jgi:hypothetical protein
MIEKILQFLYHVAAQPEQKMLRRLISEWRLIKLTVAGFGLKSSEYGRKTIHVIGDSHATTFSGYPGFTVHWIGPATAYNLIEDNSTTKSKAIIFGLLHNIDKRDKILVVFGENDCRIQVYNAYMTDKQVKPIEDYVKATVSRYGKFLKLLKERKGLDFAVLTVPPAVYGGQRYKLSYYASKEVRAKINKEFNEKLKLFCQENNIKCIDIYDKLATEDGLIKLNYLRDDIHLNRDVIPFVCEELKKVNMMN